jgi:hypothetical protein
MKETHSSIAGATEPKEGILSWTESVTSGSQSSKLKVPQVSPIRRPAHDPEKQRARAKPSGDLVPRNQTRSKLPDILCALTHDKSRNLICFGRARSPLITSGRP